MAGTTYIKWASLAAAKDRKDPGQDKIEQGWTIEKPSHATLNFWMNRTDERLDELEAKVAQLTAQLAAQ